MMKKKNILHWVMVVMMTPLLNSCADEIVGSAGSVNSLLAFEVGVNSGAPDIKPFDGATRAANDSTDNNVAMSSAFDGFFPTSSVQLSSDEGDTIYANCDERSGINMHNNVDYNTTRGSIMTTDAFYEFFALYGYVYDRNSDWASVKGSTDVESIISGIEMAKSSDNIWKATSVCWPGSSKKATFFAVAPSTAKSNVTPNQDGPTITYTVPNNVDNQEDLLVAKSDDDILCDGNNAPSLTFNHALAAIKFVRGTLTGYSSISKVEISGVYNSGTLSSFDTREWTVETTSTDSYSIESLSDVMFLMPQNFPNDAEIKVTFSDGSNSQEFTAKLKDETHTSWLAGHQYTYSLSVNQVTCTLKFEVTQSTSSVSASSDGDVTFTVKSVLDYSTGTSVKIPWQATYSLDGYTITKSGEGGDPSKEKLTDAEFTITVPASGTPGSHKLELQSRTVKGKSEDPFDLSTEYNGNVNTANCYVITSPGYYKLPLVYGNAVKNGEANTSAYSSETFVDHNGTNITQPYIYETDYGPENATLLWQDAPNLVTDLGLISDNGTNKYLKFQVSQTNIDQGNAVIAVQNSSGTTLWSWHIWVTDHAYRSTIAVQNSTSKTAHFMPVPLGWCAPSGSTGTSKEYSVNFSQTKSGGLSLTKTISQVASQNTADNAPYYQWGRKDPFVGSTGSANTTKDWYDASGTKKENINPETTTTRTKAESIKYPEKFIKNFSTWDGTTTYDNWNANLQSNTYPKPVNNDTEVVKTVYDPSPVGFKMPTTNAFTGFGSDSSVEYEGSWEAGYNFKTGLSDPTSIYFRANGFRNNNGVLRSVTTNGYYWTSGPYSTSSYGCHLSFYSGKVTPTQNSLRVYGLSVRPVSE